VLVIGGGINGLSTLYHLARRPGLNAGLIDQFTIGHDRGSSHGKSRITRSSYGSVDYVRLMRVALDQEWPRLERDAGRQLLFKCPGCFFGPACATFEEYAQAVAAAGSAVERIDAATARRRFPQFRFDDIGGVLVDHTAGVLAAQDTIQVLARLCRQRSATIREGTRVFDVRLDRDPIEVRTDQGVVRAARLVITAGAWVGNLLPWLKPNLTVVRQTVGYFRLAGPLEDYRPGRFPVWVYLADGANNKFYGLPEFGRPGCKLARHRTFGPADDPDRVPERYSPDAIADLRRFLQAHFVAPVVDLLAAEHCLYTNTANEDLLIDMHPEDSRVVIGSACSGHAFKFGPLTGRILAELACDGQSTVREFEVARARFKITRPAPRFDSPDATTRR
jgi:sarcosine oxidase